MGRVSGIDADTRIAPLRIAYDALIEGELRSPFLDELESKGTECARANHSNAER